MKTENADMRIQEEASAAVSKIAVSAAGTANALADVPWARISAIMTCIYTGLMIGFLLYEKWRNRNG